MNTIKTVTIGSQEWMSLNLNVTTFRNGDPVFIAKNAEEWQEAAKNKQSACCHYEFNAENGSRYGLLYNWYAMDDRRKLAPKGFHIPRYMEWEILNTYMQKENREGLFISISENNDDESYLDEDAFIINGSHGVIYTGAFSKYGSPDYWIWKERILASFDSDLKKISMGHLQLIPGYQGKGMGLYIRCLKD